MYIKLKSENFLCFLNFFVADVAGGIGPYIAVFLINLKHWDPFHIGVILSLTSVSSLIAQTPAGIIIDNIKSKRALLSTAIGIITTATIFIAFYPTFWAVAIAQVIIGISATLIGPCINAITLGIVGQNKFTHQIGQNEAYNHTGNVFAALIIGMLSRHLGIYSVFYLLVIMAILAEICVLNIKSDKINHDIARGLCNSKNRAASSLLEVIKQPNVLLFAVCVFIFHFANAPMLPLLGQELALITKGYGIISMSACILVAQITMIFMAIFVGKKADKWGRKPIFLIAFICLPLRGFLYTIFKNAYILISIQILDGVGAGIFGALFPIIISDLTWGTGRFNATLSAVATIQGIGVSLSNIISGFIVTKAGYNFGYMILSMVAIVGLIVYIFTIPETLRRRNYNSPQKLDRSKC